MTVHAAISGPILVFDQTYTVENALVDMQAAGQECAAIVDTDKKLIGVFSYRILLRNILPVSVTMADGSRMDVRVGAAPGIALRLKKAMPLPVTEFMDKKYPVIAPDASLWEGVSLCSDLPGPVLLADPESGKPVGFISVASVLQELNRLKDS